jgi:type IV pilus assembly protein PilM
MFSQLFNKNESMMVGIDIGSHCVKAVLVSKPSSGYRLEAAAIEPIPKGAMSERAIQDIEAIGKVVGKIKRRLPKTANSAAVAVFG